MAPVSRDRGADEDDDDDDEWGDAEDGGGVKTGDDVLTSILGLTVTPMSNATLLFVALRLIGIIGWSWWLVTLPAILWGSLFSVSVVFTVAGNIEGGGGGR